MKTTSLLFTASIFAVLFTACTTEEEGGSTSRGTSTTSESSASSSRGGGPANVLRTESAEDGAAAFAAAAKSAVADHGNPFSFNWENYDPKRTPQYNFETAGSVSDEQLGNYWVEMKCLVDDKDVGTVAVSLWPQKAPLHVRRFLRHCDEGFYDGLTFHRIVREFMVQGGDPGGTGAGDGPHGNIKGEFSDDPEWAHGYGVLSMARGGGTDSASCQFFICNAETPSVWNLDGKYSSFGKITAGVSALEAMSNAPTVRDGRENSKPKVTVLIESAVVREGEPPRGEVIERPQPDFGGQPALVEVQHILLSFAGANPRIPATRTRKETEALVNDIVERARNGEDFVAMVREFSDDPVNPADKNPGVYKLLNTGAFEKPDRAAMAKMEAAQSEWDSSIKDLQAKLAKGELTQQQMQEQANALRSRLMESVPKSAMPRAQMVSGFSETAFSLAVGEVKVCVYDKTASPFGFHIMKRLK